MEAGRRASGSAWGWRPAGALVPILLLALVVGALRRHRLVARRAARRQPPADEFDVRRVEFKPGEIRIRVTNPQTDDLTIASVTVDDAIVPFSLDGPTTSGGCARARSSCRSTGSRTSRSRSA